MVECVALEMRSTGNRTGGSNPSLSAILGPLRTFMAPFYSGPGRSHSQPPFMLDFRASTPSGLLTRFSVRHACPASRAAACNSFTLRGPSARKSRSQSRASEDAPPSPSGSASASARMDLASPSIAFPNADNRREYAGESRPARVAPRAYSKPPAVRPVVALRPNEHATRRTARYPRLVVPSRRQKQYGRARRRLQSP